MKTVNRLVFVCLFIVGAFSTSTAMACTTSLWLGAETGSPVAGSPAAVSRVSGLCAMQLTAAGGSVTDNSPSVETTAIIRFYVFSQLTSGTPVIFQAFSGNDGGGSSLITVTIDGSNFIFNAGSGPSAPVAGKSGWNLVEMAWTGGGNMEYWVNTNAISAGAQGSVAAAAGTMESVVLGAAGTLDGKLTFDDYESHRSTAVGALLMGDSNGNGSINVFDLISIQNDILGNALAIGQPDCNLNGSVNVFDLICAQNLILGN